MTRACQQVLPLLSADAVQVGSVAGLVETEAGGVMFVGGMVTFAFAAEDVLGGLGTGMAYDRGACSRHVAFVPSLGRVSDWCSPSGAGPSPASNSADKTLERTQPFTNDLSTSGVLGPAGPSPVVTGP